MNPEVRRESQREHSAWIAMFRLLRESGAVTKDDAEASSKATHTPGLKLCAAIREWGEALVRLELASARELFPKDYRPDPRVISARLTAAVREADQRFETVGGSSCHYVNDCLLPAIKDARLLVTEDTP